MTDLNPDRITKTISITLLPQANGHYLCQLASSPSGFSTPDIQCYGQTQEHAMAIALEQLAPQYRQIAEEQQNIDWDAVRSEFGTSINQRYHVILHYERIAEDESKFEAMHNTIMGNTVVENAKITVIEIDSDLQVEPLER